MFVAFIGKVIAKSKGAVAGSIIAICSVAQTLLQTFHSTLVADVRKIKEQFEKRLDADTMKMVAEAAEAAYKVTPVAHGEEMRRLAAERQAIENRKLAAEAAVVEAAADKARVDAAREQLHLMQEVIEEARKKRFADAQQEVFDALQQFQKEGGTLYVDPEQLKKLLQYKNLPPPPESGS